MCAECGGCGEDFGAQPRVYLPCELVLWLRKPQFPSDELNGQISPSPAPLKSHWSVELCVSQTVSSPRAKYLVQTTCTQLLE